MNLLKTKRASLRAFKSDDFKKLYKMMSDDRVMKFTGFKKAQTEDRSLELLNKWIDEGKKKFGVWAAEESSTSEFLGWFMLKPTVTKDPEIGFMIPFQEWGKGFATEIAEGLLSYAFERCDVKTVIASTVESNLASISVLKKIGMTESKNIDQSGDIIYFEKYK